MTLCSCGRAVCPPGMDLCDYCRADYEERAYHREQEEQRFEEQQREYEAWLNEQAAGR